MVLTRRHWIGGMLGGLSVTGGSALYATRVEPNWHEVSETAVRRPGFPRLRILHVSDLLTSDGMTAPALERALALGLERKPDLICFTGDYVTRTSGFDETGLRRLLRRAAQVAPAYGVMGNHDGGRWLSQFGGHPTSRKLRDVLEASGVEVLHNRNARLSNGLTLVGVGDIAAQELDADRAFAGAGEGPRVFLCHNPDGKDRLRKDHRWDLMLSGHTHGGQVKLPVFGSPWAPVSDRRYIAGLYEWRGRHLYITRGAGSPHHVRFGARPELSILDLSA